MMNVYNIIVSKKNVKSDVVGDYLKKVFSYTWELVKNKKGETWYCAREIPVNIDDFVTAIKCLDKRIDGVLITKIIIESACYNNGGSFDVEGYVDGNEKYHPGSKEMLEILMNKK